MGIFVAAERQTEETAAPGCLVPPQYGNDGRDSRPRLSGTSRMHRRGRLCLPNTETTGETAALGCRVPQECTGEGACASPIRKRRERQPPPAVWYLRNAQARAPVPPQYGNDGRDSRPRLSRTMDVIQSRRKLPHIYVSGRAYFLTFRLSVKQRVPLTEAERTLVAQCIHSMGPGSCPAFVVMPDHVHLIYQSAQNEDMRRTLQALKGSSAHALTKGSERVAPIWQAESFDRLIRNEDELQKSWTYLEQNPLRGGLCARPEEYRWSSAFERISRFQRDK